MGLSLKPLGKKIVDVFSADTESDQQKRVAAGQPRYYADQQRAMGNMRPATNPGAAIFGNTARLLNTARAGAGGLYGLGKLGVSSVFGSDDDYNRTLRGVNSTLRSDLSPTGGLFHAGTFFDSPEEATNITPGTFTKKVIAGGAGAAGEILPVGNGASAARQGLRIIPKVAAQGAALAGAGDAGDQYIRTGRIDPREVAASAAVGGTVGAAVPAVAAGARQLPKVYSKLESAGLPPQYRLSLEDRRVLSDYTDSLVNKGGYRPKPAERSRLIAQARDIGKKTGLDVVSGSPHDVNLRIGDFLENYDTRRKAITQGGYVGGGKTEKPVVTEALPKATAKTQPNVVPTRPSVKSRGFKKNVFKSNFYDGNPTAKEVVEAMPGYKPITNKRTLTKAANNIQQNPEAEFARVITKPQLTTADDVATGNLLLRDAIEKGDIETAIQLGTKLGIDGTKLGQAVQAYATWKKTTPEGILRYATKKAGGAGRQLDAKTGQRLVDEAKRIATLPEGLERAKATRELLAEADKTGRTWKDAVSEIMNTPRAAMATADFSAPLRQGAVLGSRFPKEFAKSFADSVKYFFKPGAYEQAMYDISQRPTYNLMRAHKLAVTGAQDLSSTEELFLSGFLESNAAKKAGVGHLVAASSRAYSGFLTKLRADVFDKVVKDAQSAGVKLDSKALSSLAKFINSASGRGSGATLDKHVGLLSQALFSPRLWKSRIDTINPVYYARLDPVARKYALQSAASFFGIVGTVLGLAKLAGADVETDPRSADFAKIKIGNTRYDVLGGIQQNVRLAAQQITGQKINSETGELQTLGPERGFGKPSRLDLLYQFFENKENPAVSYGTKLLRGTDAAGNKVNPVTEGAKLLIPLNAQGTYDTAKDQNSVTKGAAMNVPGVFGIGVQTYGGNKNKAGTPQDNKSKVSVNNEKDALQDSAGGGYTLSELSNGKYGYTLVGDETVHTARSKADASKAIARDQFEKSGAKKKLVGDTYFYKTKDGETKSKPKAQYEFEQQDAKLNLAMDRAYEAHNLGDWLSAAQQKFDALEQKKSLYDPETEQDEIDKITLQQENLQQKAEKYSQKGIGSGSDSGAGSAYRYAVSLSAGGSAPRVSVRTATRPNVRSKASKKRARPKVAIKRSLV